MIGRISPPKEFDEELERLTTPPNEGEPALFETKQKALMFAAALGRRRSQRTPLERKGTAIRYDVFRGAMDDGYIDALAIAATGDLQVLAEERSEERITIFEEYAYTGMREIVERCFRSAGDPLEELLVIADEARAEAVEGLGAMEPNVLKKLMGK